MASGAFTSYRRFCTSGLRFETGWLPHNIPFVFDFLLGSGIDVCGIAIPGMWEKKADLVVKRIPQIGINRLLYGSDAATVNNLPKDALKRWHSVPLTQEEFRKIESNVAPYVRGWLSAAGPWR